MSISHAKKAEIVRRQQTVADLYVKGWPQSAIAQELGVSQPTVCTDLKTIHKQWRAAAIRDFDLAREIELKKLDRLEREAWAAWEKSKKPSQEATVSSDGSAQKTVKKVVEQSGDPRYLEMVHKSIASRRALLGLDAPTKIAPTDPTGEKAYHSHVMAELMRLSEHVAGGPDVIDATLVEAAMDAPALEHNGSPSGNSDGALADSNLQESDAA